MKHLCRLGYGLGVLFFGATIYALVGMLAWLLIAEHWIIFLCLIVQPIAYWLGLINADDDV